MFFSAQKEHEGNKNFIDNQAPSAMNCSHIPAYTRSCPLWKIPRDRPFSGRLRKGVFADFDFIELEVRHQRTSGSMMVKFAVSPGTK